MVQKPPSRKKRINYHGNRLAHIDCEILSLLEKDLGFPFVQMSSILEMDGNNNFYSSQNKRVTILIIQKSISNPLLNYESFQFIPNLPKLSYFYLRTIGIPSLFDWIGNFNTLITLRLENLELNHLPDIIGNLISLESLSLCNNKLIHLPDAIGNLKLLKNLNVDNNQLITVPESFENLRSLQMLFLRNNNIQILPRCFASLLKSIMFCWIRNNPIIPVSLNNSETFQEVRDYLNFYLQLPDVLIERIRQNIPLTDHELSCPSLYQYSSIIEDFCNSHENPTSKAILTRLFTDGNIKTNHINLKL